MRRQTTSDEINNCYFILFYPSQDGHYLQTCQVSERVCDVINRMVDAGVSCGDDYDRSSYDDS